MALPKVETPTYELTLPSADVVIKYRPFLVREEKILLLAQEEGKPQGIQNAIMDIVKSCTFDSFDVAKAPMFDIEYVFLNIRAKSVGEVQEIRILCPDDKKTYGKVEVNLSEVMVQVDDDHTNKVIIDKARNLGVVFRYPCLADMTDDLVDSKTDINNIMDLIIKSVDHIFEGDKIYPAKEATKDELNDFFSDMNQDSFGEVKKFFETMPRLRHEVEVENPKTKVKSKVVLSGVNDFFV